MITLKSSFLTLTCLSLFSVHCVADTKKPVPVQNTTEAEQFFKKELDFKTNAYATKKVVDGEVKNVTIVDVRSAESYKAGHIPGAINLPDEKYNSFTGNETEFPGLRKDGYNYVYCYHGTCNLSQKAAMKFASLGYPVKEIVGGYDGYKDRYPVEK